MFDLFSIFHRLKCYNPVILGVGVGRFYRGAKPTVLAFEVFLGDPTGPTAETSNTNPGSLGY